MISKEEAIKKIEENFKGQAIELVKNGNGCENSVCAYLTDDGKKCAIGCFIPDGHNGQTFNGEVGELLLNYPELKEYMPSDDIELLRDMQDIHDCWPGSDEVLKKELIIFIKEEL